MQSRQRQDLNPLSCQDQKLCRHFHWRKLKCTNKENVNSKRHSA